MRSVYARVSIHVETDDWAWDQGLRQHVVTNGVDSVLRVSQCPPTDVHIEDLNKIVWDHDKTVAAMFGGAFHRVPGDHRDTHMLPRIFVAGRGGGGG
jgi:hypothetical protein